MTMSSIFHIESEEAKAHDLVMAAEPLKTHISDDVLAKAAAYVAAKSFEHHVEQHGWEHGLGKVEEPPTVEGLEKAKTMLAASADDFIDEIIDEKELTGVDIEKTRREALVKAETKVTNHYWNANTATITISGMTSQNIQGDDDPWSTERHF